MVTNGAIFAYICANHETSSFEKSLLVLHKRLMGHTGYVQTTNTFTCTLLHFLAVTSANFT